MSVDNVRPQWLNLIRRMQAGCSQREGARKQAGYSIMKIEVLIDPAGNPVFWREPLFSNIEPGSSSAGFLDRLVAGARSEQDSG